MLKILFISNFKNLPIAFLIALIFILGIEYHGRTNFSQKYFNHEVDHVLHKVDSHRFDADYLLIGDSVALQLFRQFANDSRFAVLATNQAIETTGQLLLAKRYLQNNSQPKAVIFSGLPFFYRNLEQDYTENFVLRTFTRPDEILTVVKTKPDPAIAVKMFFYQAISSYKYRLKLQKSLTGFTNSNIYSGVDKLSDKSKPGNYSLTKIITRNIQQEKTSYAHFVELLDLLDKQGIDIYYIPVPIKKQSGPNASPDSRQHEKLMSVQLPPLRDKYSHFHYFQKLVEHDERFFRDDAHYTPEDLFHGEAYMREMIDLVLKYNAYSFKPYRVAHAGGGIDKKTYTNSYEALTRNKGLGFTYFELDFSFTSDEHLVCLHDWQDSFKRSFGHESHGKKTLAEFEQLVEENSAYTKCTLDGLIKWLKKNPSVKIVTDVKEDNLKALSIISESFPQAKRRFIPQIYFPENFTAVKKLGFEQIIWSLYRYQGTNDEIIKWAQTFNGPIAVTMPKHIAVTGLPQALQKFDIPTYVHLINTRNKLDRYLGIYGVTEVYTAFLPPQ